MGKHMIELDELDAMQRVGEWPAVLSFISRPSDHFRLKYGRRSGDFPRQCIFGGTTEREEWLRDYAGHRRWWPVACGPHIDLAALEQDRDQLWAEAVHRYRAGELWYLHEPTLIERAAQENESRTNSDLWEDIFRAYLLTRQSATITKALEHLGVPLDRQTEREKRRGAAILRKLKWMRNIDPHSGLPPNSWVPRPLGLDLTSD